MAIFRHSVVISPERASIQQHPCCPISKQGCKSSITQRILAVVHMAPILHLSIRGFRRYPARTSTTTGKEYHHEEHPYVGTVRSSFRPPLRFRRAAQEKFAPMYMGVSAGAYVPAGAGPRRFQRRARLCRSRELRVHVQSVFRRADRPRVLPDHGQRRNESSAIPLALSAQARRSDRLRRAVCTRRRWRLFLLADDLRFGIRQQHGFRGSCGRRPQLRVREVPDRR